MADENAKIDDNYKKVLLAITDDGNQEIRMLRVDPTTKRLKVSAIVTSGAGISSLNGLTGATQTFTNDTNVTIVSAGTAHAITWSGTLSHERGGLEADVSAYNGLVFISGGATSTKAIGTDVQAYDAGLNSIAGLTTAADKMIYTTALDTYAVTDLSSFARTILDDANGGAVMTTLGITAFAQTMLDDVDASAVKTTLSLNNVENTALSTWAGSSNITTLGTVTTGTLSTGAIIGGVTMTLGSDADGDMYYRSSNVLTRLAKGTANQFLAMNSGATAPEWRAMAEASDLNIGTDATKPVSSDALAGSYAGTKVMQLVAFDWTTATATGDGAAYFRTPPSMNGMNLVAVAATVITAGTTGTLDVQVHNLTQAADMLSTVITVDSGETDSSSAATPAVIDTNNDDVSTGDVIRIDVDAVHTTPAQGLIITLEFRLP